MDGVAGRTDEAVRAFFAGVGARMLSAGALVPAVAEYLAAEMTPLEGEAGLGHVLEVGCGHGMHAAWAAARGMRYDGLDLVAGPADRVSAGVDAVPGLPPGCRVHVGSSEALDVLWAVPSPPAPHSPPARPGESVVVLPFNCVGSLARPGRTVASAARVGARLYLSAFSTARAATERRLELYARSGCTGIEVSASDRGVLMTSAEGLCSYAYEEAHLVRLAATHGYRCAWSVALAEVGRGLFFTTGETPARDLR